MRKILSFIIIFAACFFAIRALLVPGFFTMHDDEQIARLYDLNNSLLAGQMPPRWVSHLGFGYGYPLFNFYPPFVYYAGELFYLLGFSLINATKIVMVLGFLLSALFMYLWVKNRYGAFAGIVSAVLYTYGPYHGVDLYVRGAFAEFFSFVWIPAIFWSLDLAVKKRSYGWGMLSGIFLAFLVLTHNLTALAFIPFYIAYLSLISFENKQYIKQLIPIVIISGITALGFSAYFWLPALLEKKYTLVDNILTKELASYKIHFLYPQQLWSSPWGYGGSIVGPDDGLSLQVGKVHILVAIFSLVGILILLIRRKKIMVPFVIFCLFLFSVCMTVTYSQPIWDALPPLWYIQFPWRFLVFSVAFASFLGGFFIAFLQKYLPRNIVYGIGIILSCIAIVLIAKYFHPQKYLPVTDSFYTTNHDIEWRVSDMSFEYAPKGIKTILVNGTTHLPVFKNTIPQKTYEVLAKDMQVSIITNKPQDKEFTVKAQDDGLLVINTFSFPGWETFVDGKRVSYSDNNRLKLIVLSIPKGNHTVKVLFRDTFVRTVGNILSGITLIALFLYFLLSSQRFFKNK
ncbi:MAG TPA: 6-pyruvoyl-tetrahydropterin synthase-related protein [Candidatus Saccharimonadales bacterium]|nr:6-pyruvoyl-tetrahydropterin synthase-related protein [Candidatus Saccharimonadales bacterium]